MVVTGHWQAGRQCQLHQLPRRQHHRVGVSELPPLLTCTAPAGYRWSPWCLQDIKFNVHAHPTLSEVLDELFKQAHVDGPASKAAAAAPAATTNTAKQPVAA
jgi:hypothetical protein